MIALDHVQPHGTRIFDHPQVHRPQALELVDVVAVGIGKPAVGLAVFAFFQPHHLRLGAVAQVQAVMVFLELFVDAPQVASAIRGQECARVLSLLAVAEQGAPHARNPLVPRQLAEGLRLRDAHQFLLVRSVPEVFAVAVQEQVDGRAVDQLETALGDGFPMIRRNALAADPSCDRHELEIQILDTQLVDLAAHLLDQIVPAILSHKDFDIRHVAFPFWRAVPTPITPLRRLT